MKLRLEYALIATLVLIACLSAAINAQTGIVKGKVKEQGGKALEGVLVRAIRRLNAETPLQYVPTFLGAHIVPDEFKGRSAEYVDLIISEMLPRIAAEKLAEFLFTNGPHGVQNRYLVEKLTT